MTSSDSALPGGPWLRQQAEEIAERDALAAAVNRADLSHEGMQQTIHNLRVHQIELELQNDELRRVHAELDTAQARYFDFYDLAPVGYVTVDMQGLLLQANLTTASMLGVTRSKLLGQKMSRFICAEDQDAYYLLRKQLLVGGKPLSCEFRISKDKPESPPCWLHLDAILAHQDIGTRVLRGVLSDVTTRRRTEDRLRESEQKLSLVLENVDAYIYLKDTQGRYLFANKAVQQLFAASMEEIVGQGDASFFDAATTAEMHKNDLPVFQNGQTARTEDNDLRLRNGRKLTVLSVKLPLRNSAGEVVALCGVSTDITERKQAEAARLANSKFRDAIIDSVPSQIAVLDRHGIIVAVNQGWRDAALDNSATPGKPASNTHVGINYLDICHAARQRESRHDASRMHDGILSVIAGTQPSFHHEYPCHSPTAQRWFSVSVSPLHLEDPGVVVTHTEITEYKLLQAAQLMRAVEDGLAATRQQLRELVALNEATREEERKHIAREVHDELGQVLTALRMDMSLLGMRHGPQDAALHAEVQSMKILVDRAILGVRNVATHLRPVALDMGLVPAIEWLCQEFTRTNVLACTLDAQGMLELDESRAVVIFRIVQESLTNITRYARASAVAVTLSRRGRNLWLEVRDDGCGFDVDAAGQKGSFGLLGMRERAIALGGCLDVASAPGRGTLVSLTIPFTADMIGSQA